MNLPDINQTEFAEFLEAVSDTYGAEQVYFTGVCVNSNLNDYKNWKFCLVNKSRSTHLLVPAKLAFFFINLALSNVSPLPYTITTQTISYARLSYLHRKYIFYMGYFNNTIVH